MSEDDEYEYIEEVSYVTLDMGAAATPEYIDQVANNPGGCRLIGLEEGKAYLQLGTFVFEGAPDETIGTHMLFEINESQRETTGLLPLLSSMRSEPTDGPKSRYVASYLCSTEKYIQMNPISLEKKSKPENEMDIDNNTAL
ncbi:hypothetical protein K501DRAFT_288128 [Backusella circina FSU 941]|nr:hypothetical protein K501DRAFT_288128 [Backusella circina FSU 941]